MPTSEWASRVVRAVSVYLWIPGQAGDDKKMAGGDEERMAGDEDNDLFYTFSF